MSPLKVLMEPINTVDKVDSRLFESYEWKVCKRGPMTFVPIPMVISDFMGLQRGEILEVAIRRALLQSQNRSLHSKLRNDRPATVSGSPNHPEKPASRGAKAKGRGNCSSWEHNLGADRIDHATPKGLSRVARRPPKAEPKNQRIPTPLTSVSESSVEKTGTLRTPSQLGADQASGTKSGKSGIETLKIERNIPVVGDKASELACKRQPVLSNSRVNANTRVNALTTTITSTRPKARVNATTPPSRNHFPCVSSPPRALPSSTSKSAINRASVNTGKRVNATSERATLCSGKRERVGLALRSGNDNSSKRFSVALHSGKRLSANKESKIEYQRNPLGSELERSIIYVDGSCHPNPGKMAWAVVNEYGRCLHSFISNKIGTSQVAEHEAIIAGLRIASKMRLDHFDICTDSSVPFGHFVKGWKCQRKFERYRTLYRLLSVGFKDVRLVLIKESENLAHEAAQPDGGILHEN